MAQTKLNDQDVEEIKSSNEPARVLADRYGVHKQTIYKTRRGVRNQNRGRPLKRGRPRTRFSKPCGCGCSQMTSPGKKFRAGHFSRVVRRGACSSNLTLPTGRNRDPIEPGARFGRLTVLEPVEGCTRAGRKYRCRCDCGGEATPMGYKLRNGHTASCGCLQRERASEANLVHGGSRRGQRHPAYSTWKAMRTRCYNPRNPDYRWWGGRGIKVCDEWRGPGGFQAFLEHVSSLPHYGEPGRSMDRIDNDGDYEPGNIRWATQLQQAHNRRPRRRKASA